MKKIVLFLLFLTMQTVLLAQEYYPEGTKWTEIRLDTLKYDSWYSKVGDEWIPNYETIEYYVKGEYPDRDWVYKTVYTNGPEWTDSLTLLIREVDNLVEVTVLVQVQDGEFGSGCLLPAQAYDFDWSVGKGLYYMDINSSNTTMIAPPHTYYGVIDEIKEKYFGGVKPLKYADLDGKAPEDSQYPRNGNTNGGRIIQGIGIAEWNRGECLFGPPCPYEAATGDFYKRHYRSRLVHFERNGEVLYDVWPEKGGTDGIKSINNVKLPIVTTVYDLYGRKMQQSAQKGVFIQNGRKYIVK